MNNGSYFYTPPQTPHDPRFASPTPVPPAVPAARPYEKTLSEPKSSTSAGPGAPPAPQQYHPPAGAPPPPPNNQPSDLKHGASNQYVIPDFNHPVPPPPKDSNESNDETANSKAETSETDKQTSKRRRRKGKKGGKIEELPLHPECNVAIVARDYMKYHDERDQSTKICLWIFLTYVIMIGLALVAFVLAFNITHCFGLCKGFQHVDVFPLSALW